MENQYLTLDKNICGARVFLNVFGLTLEQQDEINEFTNLKIFNTNNNEVGVLYFDNGIVNMQANSNFGHLIAKYDLTSFFELNDIEDSAMYYSWYHDIDFNVFSQDKINFSGNMQIQCSMDTSLGINCNTHTLIEVVQGLSKTTLKFMRDGAAFNYNSINQSGKEYIYINPYSDNQFISYYLREGDYDKDNGGFMYEKKSGVGVKSNADKILKSFCSTTEYMQNTLYVEDFEPMYGINVSAESVIQKGLLMQKIDSDFVKRIEKVRDIFVNGDVSLIDNIIDISFSNYSDEEVQALFGIERRKVNYQNGANNLVDAYYGIGVNNKFLSKGMQKRLENSL